MRNQNQWMRSCSHGSVEGLYTMCLLVEKAEHVDRFVKEVLEAAVRQLSS